MLFFTKLNLCMSFFSLYCQMPDKKYAVAVFESEEVEGEETVEIVSASWLSSKQVNRTLSYFFTYFLCSFMGQVRSPGYAVL